MESNLGPITIDGEPKQNIHFRYAGEKKHNGFITTNRKPDECPKIKLHLKREDKRDNKRKWYILCSMHSYRDGPKSLSPHVLEKACDGPVKYEFIFEEMQEDDANPLERYWVLDKYRVRRISRSQLKTSLVQKCQHYRSLNLPLDFKLIQGDVDFESKKKVEREKSLKEGDVDFESKKKVEREKSLEDSAVLNVCLGFTIFEKDNDKDEYRLYSRTIYSRNIIAGDDLNTELCNFKGKIAGGKDIFILGNFKAQIDFKVHLFNNDIPWHETPDFKIIRQTAIKFRLPEGPPDMDDDEIEVYIRVVAGNSTYASVDMKFCYTNYGDAARPRKQARRENNGVVPPEQGLLINPDDNADEDIQINPDIIPDEEHLSEQVLPNNADGITNEELPIDPDNIQDHDLPFDLNEFLKEASDLLPNIYDGVETSDVPTTSYVSKDCVHPAAYADEAKSYSLKRMQIIDLQMKIKDFFTHILTKPNVGKNIQLYVKSGNTIFHEAIMDENILVTIRQHLKNSPHKQLILKARNDFRQNLLHYACLKNKPQSIRPLVGMGCGLHEQDWQGRTPLHIAIERQNTNCIAEMQKLLERHSEYTADVQVQLIKMFKVYNDEGFTVVHAAVVANLRTLVAAMLTFCLAHDVDVLQHEVLGKGDSIFHLMVKRNLVEMIQLVQKYVPFDLKRTNYQGQTVLADVEDLSLEMSLVLNIKDSYEAAVF